MNLSGFIKKKWLTAFAIILTVGIRLIYFPRLNGQVVILDEIMYWTHAANLSGWEWLGVSPRWYPYGYSFLLVPLMALTHNMTLLYHLAICVNILLAVGSFFVFMKLSDAMELNLSEPQKVIFAALATNCAAYVFQSQIAWPETLIYFWFLLTLLTFTHFLRKRNLVSAILFGIVAGSNYIIHNRNIVILIALGIVIVLMLLSRDAKIYNSLLIVAVISLILLANFYFKKYLVGIEWPDGTVTSFSGNNVASSSYKLSLFTSLNGWWSLILSFLGKSWYVLTSTFLIGGWGIFHIAKKLSIKSWKNDRAGWYLYLFLMFCILGFVGVNTIINYQIKDTRIDFVFYGRYQESFTGMLMLLGLKELYDTPTIKKYVGISFAIGSSYLVCALALAYLLKDAKSLYVNAINVSGIRILKFFGARRTTFAVVVIYIIISLCFLLWHKWGQASAQNIKVSAILQVKRFICTYGIELVLAVCGMITFVNAMDVIVSRQSEWHYFDEIAGILKANLDVPVYYCGNYADDVVWKAKIRSYACDSKIYYSMPEIINDNHYYLLSFSKEDEIPSEAQFICDSANGEVTMYEVNK